MSAQLRHRAIGPTQQAYYCMDRGAAGKGLKNAWKNGPAIATQSPVIDSNTNHIDINKVDRAGDFCWRNHWLEPILNHVRVTTPVRELTREL
jgi:hypothetical protein